MLRPPGTVLILTGDADGGLATLGGSQVAPGHTEAPVVLGAVEVLHLLPGHVDHHLAHLQPCGDLILVSLINTTPPNLPSVPTSRVQVSLINGSLFYSSEKIKT